MNILNYLLFINPALAQSVSNAVNQVGDNTSSEFSKMVANVLSQIPLWIVAFVILIISYFGAILVRRSIENKLTQEGVEEEHKEVQIMAGRTSYFVTLTIGVTIALKIVGIDLSAIVAAGAFGLGFALQDIIMNLISGMMILASRHYSIGDVITVGSVTGKIEEIQTRATIIKAFDGTKVIVPNSELFSNVVISKTSNPYRKLSFVMGVGYGSNLKEVMKLTLAVVKAIPWVLKKPHPSVIFSSWGDSTIDFKINVWIDSRGGKFVKVKNQVIMDLTEAYDQAGIDIPYPISTVNFEMAEHSEEKDKETVAKMKKLSKEYKQKALPPAAFQVYQQPTYQPINPAVAPLPPTLPQPQPEQTPAPTASPVNDQGPLLVSPTPTINSSAQGWLQQALNEQLAAQNTAPAPVPTQQTNQSAPTSEPVVSAASVISSPEETENPSLAPAPTSSALPANLPASPTVNVVTAVPTLNPDVDSAASSS